MYPVILEYNCSETISKDPWTLGAGNVLSTRPPIKERKFISAYVNYISTLVDETHSMSIWLLILHFDGIEWIEGVVSCESFWIW